MPGRDRTGPLREGPMTGRGLGYCGRGDVQRGVYRGGGWRGRWGLGGGRGRGFGRGLGWGWRFDAELPPRAAEPLTETQVDRFRSEVGRLKSWLDELAGRLGAAEKSRREEEPDE